MIKNVTLGSHRQTVAPSCLTGNQDYEDTGIAPSQGTAEESIFDTYEGVTDTEVDPNSHFNPDDGPQEEPQEDNDDDVVDLAPEVTVKRRGRPTGSRNKTYEKVQRNTRQST
jgi:hypothetical protein